MPERQELLERLRNLAQRQFLSGSNDFVALIDAADLLERDRKAIREELKGELLGDEAVIQASVEIGFALQTKLPRDRREHVRAALSAALSTLEEGERG